jgi:xanthine dehydrogenase YagR molybdenum-binding subunit
MVKIVKSQVEMEGRVSERVTVVEGPQPEAWDQGAALDVVGKSEPRVDGFERVTGRATYTYDVQLPGMLHAKVLRSPFPHARITRLDTSRAELLPTVRGVLTYRDVGDVKKDGLPVLSSTLRYVGEEVAVVAADTEQAAEDAVSLIEVEYERLPFVLDPERALEPGAPQVHSSGNLAEGKPKRYERGDMDAGWSAAEVVVEETFRTQVAVHNSLETHGSVVQWVGDSITVWDSTQYVFGVRSQLAETLGVPFNSVRVICQYMGGGFGSKQGMGKYTVLAALLARKTGRAVKLMMSREEDNLCTGHRHPTIQRLKIGARRDGTLTAIDLHCVVPVGAYGSASEVDGPVRELYRCPNVRSETYAVHTNVGPAEAFRAPGYTEGVFALDSLMDILAAQLDRDPLDLRLRNYAEEDQVRGRRYTAKRLRQCYELGAEKIGWASRSGGAPSERTKRRGIGMASQVWGGAGGPPAYAVVRLNPDGTADVVAGTQDIGTGTKTVLAQIAAETLGLPLTAVRMSIGDTRDAPYGPVSAGSMTISSVGPAVRSAAVDVREQLKQLAEEVLKVPPDRLAVKDGLIFDRSSPGQAKPVSEVLARFGNTMLIGRGSRGPNTTEATIRTFGAQFAEVEVDVALGDVRLLRLVAVHDFGRVLNPLLARSQIEGGVIQGLGYALMEEQLRDEDTGITLNSNFEEYLIPTAMDMPRIEVYTIDEADPAANSLGGKGLGEPPVIPTAAAIANAIYDATGVRLTSLPMTAWRLLGEGEG